MRVTVRQALTAGVVNARYTDTARADHRRGDVVGIHRKKEVCVLLGHRSHGCNSVAVIRPGLQIYGVTTLVRRRFRSVTYCGSPASPLNESNMAQVNLRRDNGLPNIMELGASPRC
jgi:hypothetical protein